MRVPVLLSALLVLLPACGEDPSGAPTRPRAAIPQVVALSGPVAWLTRRVGGAHASVTCPMPPKADPARWGPSATELVAIQAADVIVLHGQGLERWVAFAVLPASRRVETALAVRDRWIERPAGVSHSHGSGGDLHSHGVVDPHTLLDPALAAAQATAIRDALAQRWPEHKTHYEANLASVLADLETLGDGWKDLGRLPAGQHLHAAHATYGYLARAYGWRVVDHALDPQVPPDADTLDALRASVAAQPGRFLLWPDAPTAAVAQAIQDATGLASLHVPPGERGPGNDWLARLRAAQDTLRPAFGR